MVDDDPYEAALDVAATRPTAGRGIGGWSAKTAETYRLEVVAARAWWFAERVTARQLAARHGIDVPDDAVSAAFMPWPSWRLAAYAAHLAQQGRRPATIRKAVAALRSWHRLRGHPVPDGVPALTVLQAHESTLAGQGWQPRHARPITLDAAVRILAACDRTSPRGKRDAALLMLSFCGMLTPAAMGRLRLADVYPAGEGVTVRRRPAPGRRPGPAGELLIPHWRISGEHAAEICPVEAVLAWRDTLAAAGAPTGGPLFRAVDRHGNLSGLTVTCGRPSSSDGRLDEAGMWYAVRRAAEQAGLAGDHRPTLTDLRLGGVVRRRLEGATVDELTAASGLSTLLAHIREAEHRQATP